MKLANTKSSRSSKPKGFGSILESTRTIWIEFNWVDPEDADFEIHLGKVTLTFEKDKSGLQDNKAIADWMVFTLMGCADQYEQVMNGERMSRKKGRNRKNGGRGNRSKGKRQSPSIEGLQIVDLVEERSIESLSKLSEVEIDRLTSLGLNIESIYPNQAFAFNGKECLWRIDPIDNGGRCVPLDRIDGATQKLWIKREFLIS